MRFQVSHTTRYLYDQAVSLDPHELRLRPRCDGAQKLVSHELLVEPAAAGMAQFLDQDGNACVQVWFSGMTRELQITSRFEVETLRENPFDFLLPAEAAMRLPFVYPDKLAWALAPYRQFEPGAASAMASGIAAEARGSATAFLEIATRRIFSEYSHHQRLSGPAHTAAETISAGEGTCRDFAVLLCALCRNVGLAARFVSGYEQASAGEHDPHMHAWTEVYVPGGGWRGWDASRGFAVSTGHVVVAAATEPEMATPILGGFRGGGGHEIKLQLSVQLR
jgi:transglutaminase-like putative cysteine protease